MLGALPAWVADVTALCALVAGIGAVLAVVLRMARPGFHQSVGEVVEQVTRPRFEHLERAVVDVRDQLTARIDDANDRLDAHMRAEEAQTGRVLKALDTAARTEARLDAHLADHHRASE